MRRLALTLAVVGVGLLVWAGRQRELPSIPLGSVTPAMNFSRVRVSGVVRRDPWVRWESNRLAYASFWIRDGGGELKVVIDPGAGDADAWGSALPSKGERVDVTGVLRVFADGQKHMRATALVRRREDS